MNIATHLMLARKGFKFLKEKKYKLNYFQFLYGSIYPDIFRVIERHMYVHSKDYINELIKDPTSFNLGVIHHYITDYFCKYHRSDELFFDLIEHGEHEYMLWKMWRSGKYGNHLYNEVIVNNFLSKIDREYEVLKEHVNDDLQMDYDFMRIAPHNFILGVLQGIIRKV